MRLSEPWRDRAAVDRLSLRWPAAHLVGVDLPGAPLCKISLRTTRYTSPTEPLQSTHATHHPPSPCRAHTLHITHRAPAEHITLHITHRVPHAAPNFPKSYPNIPNTPDIPDILNILNIIYFLLTTRYICARIVASTTVAHTTVVCATI